MKSIAWQRLQTASLFSSAPGAAVPDEQKASTIYDLAERAGVSTATVSRVFNQSARVSEKTRRRVLKAADDLQYQPHASAQSLARQQSHLVSAVIPVLTNDFYMNVMRGMQDALYHRDFDLIVYAAPRPDQAETQLARATQRGLAEGVLLFSTPLTDAQADRLRRSGRPIGLIDAAHPAFDSVSVDNVEGGYLATQHLIRKGFQRIAHIGAVPEPPPAAQRRAGYEKALRDAGRSVDRRLVAASRRRSSGFGEEFAEEAGYKAMEKLLGRSAVPDAVFAASDVQALGARKAIHEAGLRIPDDVAVVGFDDIGTAEHVGLTTLRQPMHAMGKLAVEKLMKRIAEPERPPSKTVFAPRLIERASSGPPLSRSETSAPGASPSDAAPADSPSNSARLSPEES